MDKKMEFGPVEYKIISETVHLEASFTVSLFITVV